MALEHNKRPIIMNFMNTALATHLGGDWEIDVNFRCLRPPSVMPHVLWPHTIHHRHLFCSSSIIMIVIYWTERTDQLTWWRSWILLWNSEQISGKNYPEVFIEFIRMNAQLKKKNYWFYSHHWIDSINLMMLPQCVTTHMELCKCRRNVWLNIAIRKCRKVHKRVNLKRWIPNGIENAIIDIDTCSHIEPVRHINSTVAPFRDSRHFDLTRYAWQAV